MEVMGGFIVGFDNDQQDVFARQFEFIQRSGVVTAMVGLLQALPQTRLYQRLVREGRIDGSATGNNTEAVLNFKTKLNREFLQNGYRELMNKLYEPNTYYRRIRTFLREYRPPKISRPLDWRSVVAFAHANLRLGILGRERFHYWGLLLWTFLRRPSHLSLAVTLSIYGHHFRKVCRLSGP